MLKDKIVQKIQEAVNRLDIKEDVHLEHPTNPAFGDYSTNVALQAAKKLKRNPFDLAHEIAHSIPTDEVIEKVDTAKPGFINIWLSKDLLLKQLIPFETVTSYEPSKEVKKVVVEYSSPNIAKPFTIGHLRSTVIGDAVANLLETSGWHVYRDNHLGDWGTQFGKQIYAIKTWGNEEELDKAENPVKILVDLYVKFHSEAEKNPELEEEGRKWFKKLEDGDTEARQLWKKCISWSMKEFRKIYSALGVTFTENPENGNMGFGESFFEKRMEIAIQDLKNSNLLKESKGAQLVFFKNDKYPPLMIIKEDGATLYSTRDLATDRFRLEYYGKDITIINEVGAEQSLYFKQLFEIEHLLGWFKPEQRIHIGHGMYRFKDKKMSTRKGNVIWLEEVLDEAIKRASGLGKEGDVDPETARKIGVGAIKWNDLKRTANQDVIFDWDDILNMQGNSGPYMQYTYVRALSVLKGQLLEPMQSAINFEPEESQLLRMIGRYNETVLKAAEQYSPHILTNYLFELAQSFNLFYQKHSILKAEPEIKNFRLLLVKQTSEIIKRGLKLLGIETVEKM